MHATYLSTWCQHKSDKIKYNKMLQFYVSSLIVVVSLGKCLLYSINFRLIFISRIFHFRIIREFLNFIRGRVLMQSIKLIIVVLKGSSHLCEWGRHTYAKVPQRRRA